MNKNWKVVSTYTNQEALNDGLLVDISEQAKEFGFLLPFYATATIQKLGPERVAELLILASMKIHSGLVDESGTIVTLEEKEGRIWVLIEGTSSRDTVMKIMFSEEY